MRIIGRTATLIIGAGLFVGLTPMTTPVSAHTHNCVTVKEWKRVTNGINIQRVHRIFDIDGQLLDKGRDPITGDPLMTRSYRMCQPGIGWVHYTRDNRQEPWHAWGKSK